MNERTGGGAAAGNVAGLNEAWGGCRNAALSIHVTKTKRGGLMKRSLGMVGGWDACVYTSMGSVLVTHHFYERVTTVDTKLK